MTKITNFVVEGFPDDIYERISKYLKSTNKCHVVEAENAFEMKCAMKGFNSVDFAIKFYILNRFYIIVEVSRIRVSFTFHVPIFHREILSSSMKFSDSCKRSLPLKREKS